jgi:RNA polymerase II elongation factor ELL
MYRERLIHLLAIRPFKKPEMQARLSRGEFLCNILFNDNETSDNKTQNLLGMVGLQKICIYIDGIKDREKNLVMTILKQISTFKNNEYVLLRGMWNDVQEDWPCYTEQEKQLMKRCVNVGEFFAFVISRFIHIF